MREPFFHFVQSNLNFKFVLITCGLPGTWKTETAAEVSKIIKITGISDGDLEKEFTYEINKNSDIKNLKGKDLVYLENFEGEIPVNLTLKHAFNFINNFICCANIFLYILQ